MNLMTCHREKLPNPFQLFHNKNVLLTPITKQNVEALSFSMSKLMAATGPCNFQILPAAA